MAISRRQLTKATPWNEARKQIEQTIKVGTDVNTENSTYRVVQQVDQTNGIIVPKSQNGNITIRWEMLKECYEPIASGREYTSQYFKDKYPKEARNATCYPHTVGQIFVKAGLAIQTTNNTYKRP